VKREQVDRNSDEPIEHRGRSRHVDFTVSAAIEPGELEVVPVEPRVDVAPSPPAPAKATLRLTTSYHRFYFRAGAFHQETNMGQTTMELPIPAPPGDGGVGMHESQVPFAAIVGYTLPILHHRLSLETIVGFPANEHFEATGSLATQSLAPTIGGMPTGIAPLGSDLGQATFATPMLTAVYHLPDLGPITPILGGGAMVLYAYDQKITNPVLTAAGKPQLDISPTAGAVLQAGLEARLWRGVTARIDAKYIAGVTVTAKVENISVIPTALPQLGTLDVGTATMTAKIAPVVVQAGIGTDF
jgi:outer membrane protein W